MNHYNTGKDISDLIREFQQEHDAKPGTLKLYKFLLHKFYYWMQVKGYDIRSPKEKQLLWWKKELLENDKSPAYINLCLSAVKSYFRWMETNGYYTAIGANVKAVTRDENFKKIPLLKEDVKKLLNSIDDTTITGTRDKALISLLFANGLRLGEALGLNISDMHEDKNLLFIKGKGRFEREPVMVNEGVINRINLYLEQRTDDITANSPMFIPHRKGTNLTPAGLTRESATEVINRRLEAAQLKRPGVTAHSLRHGAAVELILSGATLYEVSIFLRHRTLNISRLYTRYSERILMARNGPESKLFSLIQD